MLDNKSLALCNKVIKAAFAKAISDREALPFADKAKAQKKDISNKTHFSLLNFGQMGFPMGDTLVPLIETMEDYSNEEPITNYDMELDKAKGYLYDRLLNVSPPFKKDITLEDSQNSILNNIYENILRTAIFAGNVEPAASSELKDAKDLLFSTLYDLYLEYEARILDAELELKKARTEGKTNTIEILSRKISRLNAEWLVLGQKKKVEQAVDLINKSQSNAGFEDERRKFIHNLEAQKKDRISSNSSYAFVNIQPLSALIDPTKETYWTKMTYSADELKSLFDTHTRSLFGLSFKDVEYALSLISSAKFEYVVVMLEREWLQKDFIEARYWRHPDIVLSDGHGGGEAPTVPALAVFLKKAAYNLDLGLIASDGHKKSNSQVFFPVYKMAKTPLLDKTLVDHKGNKHLMSIIKYKKQEAKKMISSPKTLLEIPALYSKKESYKKKSPIKSSGIASIVKSNFFRLEKPYKIILPKHAVFPKGEVKKLTIQGSIKIDDAKINSTDFLLSAQLISHTRLVSENVLTLKKEGLDFTFKQAFQSYRGNPNEIIDYVNLRLLDTKEQSVLIEKNISMEQDDKKTINIKWIVSKISPIVGLSSPTDPTLMGYGLKILPKSPNPDENLIWQ